MNIQRDFSAGNGTDRAEEAKARRIEAAKLAAARPRPTQVSNGEEAHFRASQPTSFTKGLSHDEWGLVARNEYEVCRDALTRPDPMMSGLAIAAEGRGKPARRWESPLAGHYFDNQGPDMDAVAMAPAPRLGSSELTAEMATVYAMALLRDIPFQDLAKPGSVVEHLTFPKGHGKAGERVCVGDIVDELRKLAWFDPEKTPKGFYGTALTEQEKRRRKAQWDGDKGLTIDVLFRGSTSGAKTGPYLSQFMLVGTANRTGNVPTDGYIGYGTQVIDQRCEVATKKTDFMTRWSDWLEVQNGVDTRGGEAYEDRRRFLTTPRDLATYVHFDALYQAYLNACLILLGNGGSVDMGNPISQFRDETSEGFATWGGPHILSLVTEVATRGLRAVRRQKFQVHRRARPEVIAARLAQVASGHIGGMDAKAVKLIKQMLHEFGADDPLDHTRPGLLLHWVAEHNGAVSSAKASGADKVIPPEKNWLLPMAFSEGSPMHPAYGAGHATVAGACVTILKAFFESEERYLTALDGIDRLYEAAHGKDALQAWKGASNPTIAQELDKLAANISIGRNMAGVHYYSDYYDSLRLGERIAAGILEEQMIGYSEPVRKSFTSFDGDVVTLETDGGETAASVTMTIRRDGAPVTREDWWLRHVSDYGIAAVGV